MEAELSVPRGIGIARHNLAGYGDPALQRNQLARSRFKSCSRASNSASDRSAGQP